MMMHRIECLGCFALGGLVASVYVMSKLRFVDVDTLTWRAMRRCLRFFGRPRELEVVRDLECTLRKMYGACLAHALIEKVRSGQMKTGEIVPGVDGIGSGESDLLDEAERLYQVRIQALFGNKFE